MKARYFNNVVRQDNVVTKSSTNIYKIKSEFNYYYLLPDELKKFYVKPYNYRETEKVAMYDMDYAGITLYEFLSNIDNVHDKSKSISSIINQLRDYFNIKNKYNKVVKNDNFVLNKVENRICKLKKLPEYQKLKLFLEMVNINIDNLVLDFEEDYYNVSEEKITKTISHGDLHFSNILINEETFEIKFIDVRGATHKDELYIDQYYDYAKLLHSIKGMYDLIINDKFEIDLKEDLSSYNITYIFKNNIVSDTYNEILSEIYKDLDSNTFETIRVYTKSLFLSMLPLHKENLKHVLAFINISQML